MKNFKQFSEKMDIKKTEMGDVIKDFQASDAPQFAGKSKEKRRQMAIAAKLAAQRNEEFQSEGTIQPNGTDKIELGCDDVATTKKTKKEMQDQQNESWTFDSAAMAKQELADAKNKQHRKRGKVANLLRKLGMKEEVQPVEEGVFKGTAEVVKQAVRVPYRAVKRVAGAVLDTAKDVGDAAAKVKKKFKEEVEGTPMQEELKGGQVNLDKNHNGKLDKQDFKLLRKKLKEANMPKPAKAVDIDKVHAAGEKPHEEKWEDVKKVKKESFTAEELLQGLKEGMWPGTPEYTAKFGNQAKQGGGAGVKKGTRYGGSLQKPEKEDDNDADDKAAKKPKNK